VTRSGSGDRRLIRRSGGLLAAGVVLALGVAAVGVRAAAGAALRGAGLATGAAMGLALLFAVAALTTAGKYRTHLRATEASSTAQDRLRQATVAILFASAALVPFTLMLLRRPDPAGGAEPLPTGPTHSGAAPLGLRPSLPSRTGHPGRHFAFDLASLLWALLIAAGFAVLVAVAAVVIRLLRETPPAGPAHSAPPTDGPDAEDEALADALLAGRAALAGDDVRAAIIACYAAMEASLGEIGVAREHSDSPSDLLRRATGRDLPGTGAQGAAALTELFREARFSTHPMTARQLGAARQALDSVTDALAERIREREREIRETAQKAEAGAGAGTGTGTGVAAP
jgi:hypothetical protein